MADNQESEQTKAYCFRPSKRTSYLDSFPEERRSFLLSPLISENLRDEFLQVARLIESHPYLIEDPIGSLQATFKYGYISYVSDEGLVDCLFQLPLKNAKRLWDCLKKLDSDDVNHIITTAVNHRKYGEDKTLSTAANFGWVIKKEVCRYSLHNAKELGFSIKLGPNGNWVPATTNGCTANYLPYPNL
jgi:hypothetical protein